MYIYVYICIYMYVDVYIHLYLYGMYVFSQMCANARFAQAHELRQEAGDTVGFVRCVCVVCVRRCIHVCTCM